MATAHNADDNLETVLMRLIRGSGLRGLCGIPEKRGIYLRPLLHVTRAEIEAYLACNGIAHMEDESNADPAYTRNRIRLEILPRLRALNPNVANTVLQSGRSLAEDADYLRQTAQEALDQSCRRTAQAVDISIAVLTGAHRAGCVPDAALDGGDARLRPFPTADGGAFGYGQRALTFRNIVTERAARGAEAV